MIFSGCNSDSSQQAGTGQQAADVTSQSLNTLVGNYVSPSAKMRIHSDGKYTLETDSEAMRWYGDSGPQHYAKCSIRRTGQVKVLQQEDGKHLSLDFSEKRVLDAKVDPRSPGEDPFPICNKALRIIGAVPTLNFKLVGQVNGAFQLTNSGSQLYYQGLEGAGDKERADSDMEGQFSLLFTPAGKTVDVTDLVAPQLNGELHEIPTGSSKETLSGVTINSEFRSLRFADLECGTDTTINMMIQSNGSKITIDTADYPVAAMPVQENQNMCEHRKNQLGTSGTALFDVTDSIQIRGLDGFSNLYLTIPGAYE